MTLEKYKDKPLTVNERTIAKGINKIIALSFSTNIFLIAGSNSQAIDAVPPATPNDNTRAKINLPKCFLI